MKPRLYCIATLLCTTALLTASAAQTPLPFAQAREIILAQNPGLKSAAAETEAARAGIDQAGVLPNPGVGLALDNFGANEIEVTLGQIIELGGKRRSRIEIAQSELSAVENNRTLTQNEIEAEIVRRFIPIAAASRKLALLDSIMMIAQSTREQIQKRVAAGASRKADLVRAEIDIEQLGLERSDLMREEEQARRKFAALGDGRDSALLNVSGVVGVQTPVPSIDDLNAAVRNNPQLKMAQIEQVRLAAQESQLHAQAVPDLNLSAGYLRNNAERANSVILGASITLPLFNTNVHAQRQTRLQREAAGRRSDNSRRLIEADISDLHSRALGIDRRIAALRTNSIPKTEYVLSMMLDYYNAGSAGFLDLAASQSQMLRLRMDLFDLESERAQTLADLMQTTSFHIQIVN